MEGKSDIFTITKLFGCEQIKLSAWSQNGRRELLALVLDNGDIIFYLFTDDVPIIKSMPWLRNKVHTPLDITFNPAGTFLLMISRYGHIYIIPALSVVDPNFKKDRTFDIDDITIIPYPFINEKKRKYSSQSKLTPNSSEGNLTSSRTTENTNIIKSAMFNKDVEVISPTCVLWWQSISDSRQFAIIGTMGGDILFVDLLHGAYIGSTNVKGEIGSLLLCQDNGLDTVFLLITTHKNEQFKLLLEQKENGYTFFNSLEKKKIEFNEGIHQPVKVNVTASNIIPSARSRLQGLKQLSVEKLNNLKQKLSETRANKTAKSTTSDDTSSIKSNSSKHSNPEQPENLGAVIGDTYLSAQYSRGRHVLAGYHSPSQILTLHSMSVDIVPLFVYKMPLETDQLVLSDRLIYTFSKGRETFNVISTHLAEARLDPECEFNPESVLGTWSLTDLEPNEPTTEPTNNKILKLYKSTSKTSNFNLQEEYKLDKNCKHVVDCANIENCVVITSKNVYRVELKANIIKLALDLILVKDQIDECENICKIFCINLQHLLEVAGEVELCRSNFDKAIRLYKMSKCGHLKSVVKLACGGHCDHVLSYSSFLLTNHMPQMPLTERMHLSNLVLMAYTQQILKSQQKEKLEKQFLEFIEKNIYYDEILAVSVTGQSYLFKHLHRLMTKRGLINNTFSVLTKIMKRMMNVKTLNSLILNDDSWNCMTDSCLVEAMVADSTNIDVYIDFVLRFIDYLELEFIERLLHIFNPYSGWLRNVFKFVITHNNDEGEQCLPMQKMLHMFLSLLLIKLGKTNANVFNENMLYKITTHEIDDVIGGSQEPSESVDSEPWSTRKDLSSKREILPEKILAAGYGHSALVRNGTVYTWGYTNKGCLGNGPTMARHCTPAPNVWLSSFKLEVISVSCGRAHTVALTDNGLYSWGSSEFGQLGLGYVQQSPHPRLITSLLHEKIISVSCGQYHTLALTQQGVVYSWGWGVHGQLGNKSIDDKVFPTLVRTLKDYVVVEIASGHGHSLILTNRGQVFAFGSSVFGQLGCGNTTKSSTPLHVKTIPERVIHIATGYFQNLALTEFNMLYTWGMSPQCLRLQSQAQKRARLQGQLTLDNSPTVQTVSENTTDVWKQNEKSLMEAHLVPSVVDTRNVTERIVQIATGCHHSALVTESGSIYTWGRSLEGQLGNGSRREVPIPTLVSNLKVDIVCCGCEFTVVQEKQSSKIFGWGSNAMGQLGFGVRENSMKGIDGKLLALKSMRRVIRLPDTGTNAIEEPKQIPDIPSIVFTYQTLNKPGFSIQTQKVATTFDLGCLIRFIDQFHEVLNTQSALNKCVEYQNFQAAAKLCFLQKKYKQSLIYQLKSLQSTWKLKENKTIQTPVTEDGSPDEIHLFTVQGGQESMCDDVDSQDASKSDDSEPIPEEKAEHKAKEMEYINLALRIIDVYLNLAVTNTGTPDFLVEHVLETAIQFWIADRLSFSALENFIDKHFEKVFYQLGVLLFCQNMKIKDDAVQQQFSPSFLLKIVEETTKQIENNGNCSEYLNTLSNVMKVNSPTKKRKSKNDNLVNILTDQLKTIDTQQVNNAITVNSEQVAGDELLLFTCGHILDPVVYANKVDEIRQDKIVDKYSELLNKDKYVPMACPTCVNSYLQY